MACPCHIHAISEHCRTQLHDGDYRPMDKPWNEGKECARRHEVTASERKFDVGKDQILEKACIIKAFIYIT